MGSTTVAALLLCAVALAAQAGRVRRLVDAGVPHEVAVEDLQAKIDAVDEGSRARRSADWYEQFHSFDDIVAQLSVLAAAHPGLASVVANVSTSVEGRSIPALRLGRGGAGQNVTVLLSGIHAREWIGPPVLMWSVRGLLEDYAAGRNDARRLLDTQAVYVVPCYNPDGYEYSRSTDRYWRKNRASVGGDVVGVDLNRNWDDGHWGLGSSDDTSREDYRGPGPFSEPEVRGISRWILSLGSTVRTFVDFHSYASQVLRPYGWTSRDCPDERYLKYVGDTMAKLAGGFKSSKGGVDFRAGGCTDSWAYERAGILHSFTVELGGSDFVVDESEIRRQGAAMYPAVRFLLGLTASPAAPAVDTSSSSSSVLGAPSSSSSSTEPSASSSSSSRSHGPVVATSSSSSPSSEPSVSSSSSRGSVAASSSLSAEHAVASSSSQPAAESPSSSSEGQLAPSSSGSGSSSEWGAPSGSGSAAVALSSSGSATGSSEQASSPAGSSGSEQRVSSGSGRREASPSSHTGAQESSLSVLPVAQSSGNTASGAGRCLSQGYITAAMLLLLPLLWPAHTGDQSL
eukprot:m51a1_g5078 putative carboxypeptidase b-like (570) ;mRNA; r:229270-231366